MPLTLRAFDLANAADAWQAMPPERTATSVFQTHWWQTAWLRRFGDASAVRVLVAESDAGRPVGIAPMSVSNGTAAFIGDPNLFDYQDFIVAKGWEDDFYTAAFDHMDAWPWEEMALASAPEGSPTLRLAAEEASRRGWRVSVEATDVTPIKKLPATWEEYVAGLGKKYRHELRRKIRRVTGAGSVNQFVCAPDDLDDCLPDFFRLHRLSSPEKAEFMNSSRERFFTEIAHLAAERDQLRLSILELDGARVAACICFDAGDAFLLYNSGYDPAYAQLSVGLVNKAWAIREAIESGKRIFNFLRGVERYKYDLGAEDRAVYTIRIQR